MIERMVMFVMKYNAELQVIFGICALVCLYNMPSLITRMISDLYEYGRKDDEKI